MLRLAVNCFLLHIFKWESSQFSCTQCPRGVDGTHVPHVLVGDGTAVCVQKVHMPPATLSHDEPLHARASTSGLLIGLSGRRLKELVRAYLGGDTGISEDEFAELIRLLQKDCRADGLQGTVAQGERPLSIGPALAALLLSLPRAPSDSSRRYVPSEVAGLMQNLSTHSLVTGILPLCTLPLVENVLLSHTPPDHPADVLEELSARVPAMAEWLMSKQSAHVGDESWQMFPLCPAERDLVRALINHANLAYQQGPIDYPLAAVTTLEDDLHSAVETVFLPDLPRRVHVGAFDCDKDRDTNECKNPQGGRHGSLAPGVFLVCCEHSICWGFAVMESPESGRHVFEILRERYPEDLLGDRGTESPPLLVYDNACHAEVITRLLTWHHCLHLSACWSLHVLHFWSLVFR